MPLRELIDRSINETLSRTIATSGTVFLAILPLALMSTGEIQEFAITLLTVAGKPETKDYISYWSAGHLLRQHADPYSTPQVLALEQTQGYSKPKPLVMRNPPIALFVAEFDIGNSP